MMYDTNMIEVRGGPSYFDLDTLASDPYKPLEVITADCSGAHEFDDAINVKAFPTKQERYKVTVCSVDTSHLFHDERVLRQVINRTESKYHDPNTGNEIYEPMLDRSTTQQLHFAAGAVRKAMMVSFITGEDLPPQDIQIDFGRVRIMRNYRYNTFGDKCRYSETFEPFGRAAAHIINHLELNPKSFNEEETYKDLIHVPRTEAWKRGSSINQAFMIAAGHLVAKVVSSEDRLALYRTHDLRDKSLEKVLPPQYAHYDTEPRPHNGLNLDVFSRVTSPLRRSEDFVMLGLLKLRHREREPNHRDQVRVNQALQRLNAREVAEQFYGIRQRDEEVQTLTRRLKAVAG